MRQYLWMALCAGFLVACGQGTLGNVDDLVIGETLYAIDFEAPDTFEVGEHSVASLSIEQGRYWIRHGGERTAYIWGQGGEAAQNITVEALSDSQSSFSNNLYGLMCRVDEKGAGYAFLASNDGFVAIARTDGRSLSFLVDWQEYRGLKKGENTLRGVCVDDYLALYVNDVLVVDVEDQAYPNAGEVGLLAGLLVEARSEADEVLVSFDDLIVKEAQLKN